MPSQLVRKSHLENEYTKLKKVEDDYLGQFYLYVSKKNNSKIMVTEEIYNSREKLLRRIEEVKILITEKTDYLLQIYDFSVEFHEKLCASFYLLKIYQEFPGRNLKQEIKFREKLNLPNFKMEDLTHLLYHQIHIHQNFQNWNQFHGNICPETIYFNAKK